MNLDVGVGLSEELRREFLLHQACRKKGAFNYMEL